MRHTHHRHHERGHGCRYAHPDRPEDGPRFGRHHRGGGRSGLGRFFAHGDLRLVILGLIAEKPRRGEPEARIAPALRPQPAQPGADRRGRARRGAQLMDVAPAMAGSEARGGMALPETKKAPAVSRRSLPIAWPVAAREALVTRGVVSPR